MAFLQSTYSQSSGQDCCVLSKCSLTTVRIEALVAAFLIAEDGWRKMPLHMLLQAFGVILDWNASHCQKAEARKLVVDFLGAQDTLAELFAVVEHVGK